MSKELNFLKGPLASEDVAKALSLLSEGYTIASLSNIGQDKLDALYALAYNQYNAENFEHASTIFKVLTLLDGSCLKYYMGLGASEQKLGHYQGAADVYALGFTVDGMIDPEPLYYAAICFLKLKKKDEAITVLDTALSCGREGNEKHDKFKMKCKSLKTLLEQMPVKK